jgi:hypothetical protein
MRKGSNGRFLGIRFFNQAYDPITEEEKCIDIILKSIMML